MTKPSESNPIWIIDPKEAKIGYYLIYALGILQVFACGALVYNAVSFREYILAGLLANLALLFLVVARLLGMKKGGIAYDPKQRNWLLYGRDTSDILTIPSSEVVGLAVERRTEYWGRSPEPVLVSSLHLVLRDGLRVALLQMPTLSDAQERAEMIREATGVAPIREGGVACDELPAEAPVAKGFLARNVGEGLAFDLRTGVAGPLAWTLALAALFCLASGGLLLAGLSVTGIVGALFGPLAFFLGLGFAGFLAVRFWGWEEVELKGDVMECRYRFCGRHWGKQQIKLQPQSTLMRLVTRGVHGFQLETLQGERMMILASGSTSRTALPPSALLGLARYMWKHVRHLPAPVEAPSGTVE